MKELVKELKDAITTDKSTKPYDTTAKVVRTEGDTIWVHIDGGVDETPVAKTISAKPGDIVKVRVSGGSAWIQGNESAPPTDDTLAIIARENANAAQVAAHVASDAAKAATEDAGTARTAATQAVQDAAEAKTAADTANGLLEDMQDAAEDAGTTLTGIYADAAEAKETVDEINAYADTAGKTVTQILNDGETAGTAAQEAKAAATNASEYAARALGNLSTVQNVTETLNWITAHGTMALTSDIALDPTHVYFVQDNNGGYTVGGTKYAIVTEPDVADISTYYELSIKQSLNNYVATHLALTNEGLSIIADDNDWRVLITNDGVYIINEDGTKVATYSDFVRIGKLGSSNFKITQGEILGNNAEGYPYFSIGTGAGTIPISVNIREVKNYWVSSSDNINETVSCNTESIPIGGIAPFSGSIHIEGRALNVGSIEIEGCTITSSVSNEIDITLNTDSIEGGVYKSIQAYARGIKTLGGEFDVEILFINEAEGSNSRITYIINFAEDDPGSIVELPSIQFITAITGSISIQTPIFTLGSNAGSINGAWSARIGQALISAYANQISLGKYNQNNINSALEIGNGTSNTSRSNAFDVKWNGETRLALDTTATSGVDKTLTDAISALGWTSDVIE